MSLFHTHSIKYKGVSCHPRFVHTYPFLFENGFFFCPVWPSYRPHVFRENAHQSEDFWKRWLLVYLWPDKTEVFECDVYPFSSPEPLGSFVTDPSFPDHVTKKRRALGTRMDVYHIYYNYYACSVRDAIVFSLFSTFVWTGESDSNKLCVDTYFFKNGGKKMYVCKNSWIRVVWASVIPIAGFQCHAIQSRSK